MLAGGIVSGALVGLVIFLVVFLPLDGRRNFDLRTLIATLALALVGENLLLDKFGPAAPGLPRDLQPAADDRHRGHERHERSAGRRALGDRPRGRLRRPPRAARASASGVRALTQNVEGARLVGIDRRTAAFAILLVSGALVGVAAVLLGPVYFVSYNNGLQPMIKGLTVAMLGGLGSVRGTIVAAVIVAFVEATTATYIGAEDVLVSLFLLIAVVLLVRPRGISRHPGDDACVGSSTSPSGPS